MDVSSSTTKTWPRSMQKTLAKVLAERHEPSSEREPLAARPAFREKNTYRARSHDSLKTTETKASCRQSRRRGSSAEINRAVVDCLRFRHDRGCSHCTGLAGGNSARASAGLRAR